MAYDVVRPLMHEVLTMVNNAKVKDKKINVLRKYKSDGLKMVLKSSFDPKIVWRLPDGDVPFIKNDAPEGTEHTDLAYEARKLYNFIKGGNGQISQNKREALFVQMLEGLHPNEAQLLVAAKDKALHKEYKGLSTNVVKEAFFWNDDYMLIENETYDQIKGSASGI